MFYKNENIVIKNLQMTRSLLILYISLNDFYSLNDLGCEVNTIENYSVELQGVAKIVSKKFSE